MPFEFGTLINVTQVGAGVATVGGFARSVAERVGGGSVALDGQWSGVALVKRGADAWSFRPRWRAPSREPPDDARCPPCPRRRYRTACRYRHCLAAGYHAPRLRLHPVRRQSDRREHLGRHQLPALGAAAKAILPSDGRRYREVLCAPAVPHRFDGYMGVVSAAQREEFNVGHNPITLGSIGCRGTGTLWSSATRNRDSA